jgi:hypothetical protein
MYRVKAAGTFVVIALGSCLPADNALKPISVCAVINDLRSYDGKVVSLRAEWAGTQYHGYFLSDKYRNAPCPGFPAEGVTTPSTIFPVDPGYTDPDHNDLLGVKIPFEQDKAAMERFDQLFKEWTGAHGLKTLEATFTGQIVVPKREIKIVCRRGEGCGGNGFGPHGASAALFVLKTITDASLK